jgi:hypothetical protein
MDCPVRCGCRPAHFVRMLGSLKARIFREADAEVSKDCHQTNTKTDFLVSGVLNSGIFYTFCCSARAIEATCQEGK